MSNIIKKIAGRAKQIRKAHPSKKWTDCIKQASRELKGSAKPGSTAKKSGTAAKKKCRVGAVKSKNRQTGSSNRKRDEKRIARNPGKRVSSNGKVYYERRKNRSDKPGSLSGTGDAYKHMMLTRIKSNLSQIEQAKKRIEHFKGNIINSKVKAVKVVYRSQIKEQKKLIAALKADTTMLKRLI